MMTNKIRWAMVGSGFMAELICRDFALVENTELVAMVSRNPEAAKAKMPELGIDVPVLGSIEEAIADENIDLIYVATPHSEHHWMAKKVLEAGKHCLVEKAFTMNQAEAKELVSLARSKNVFLMEAMWTKFNPLMNEVKRRIEAGAIGELKYVETHFGFAIPFMAEHRLFRADLGGGTVLDQGIYTNTIARWMAGAEVAEIKARGELFDNGTEALALSQVRFTNGVWGFTGSSLNTALGTNARFSGTGGYVDIHGSFWSPDTAVFYRPNSRFSTDEERLDLPKTGAGYSHMINAVSQAVLEGKTETEEHPLDFTIEMMGVLDEIRRQLGSMK